ncbi:hypothetical protein ASG17_05435 [Brevundimonas sp. Leaf363]|uniref:hypothetical protein n=1 Tax=Brevundimonas sp. Leaf363 TaxID=1736353 RepID=UPI0006FFA45F|nr:hypothetical protein [Brevundimonas sp. Leaf363]KQS55521.1 hypothetical protein ASG17_05435 [Brevundimonas sp. Leaf363]
MSDATTAARQRVDKALAAVERKMLELKARPADAPRLADDDLFASVPSGAGDTVRVAELERAAREAAGALAEASRVIDGLISDADRPVQETEA